VAHLDRNRSDRALVSATPDRSDVREGRTSTVARAGGFRDAAKLGGVPASSNCPPMPTAALKHDHARSATPLGHRSANNS